MITSLKKTLMVFAAIFLVASLLPSQFLVPVAPVSVDSTFTLKPGDTVIDSKGRTVKNTSKKGLVHIKCTKGWKRVGKEITCKGEITLVRTKKSGGAKKFKVNTNGKPTDVQVDRNGDSTTGTSATTTGGKANVTMNGHYGKTTSGGTENSVTMNGNNNSGDGSNAASGGSVKYGKGSHGNSWGGTGNWTVRN